MQHIPTTPDRVSKLRKAAKLRARQGIEKLAAALDHTARDAGYAHWRHVIECQEKSCASQVAPSLTAAGLPARPSAAAAHPVRTFKVIAGRPGTGKSTMANDDVLNALRQGSGVHVLDCGRSYHELARAVGGTTVFLDITGDPEIQAHGHASLVVYDFERLGWNEPPRPLQLLPFAAPPRHGSILLVVDESYRIARWVADLAAALEQHVDEGGSTVVIAQDVGDPFVHNTLRLATARQLRRQIVTLDFDGP